MTDIPPPRYKIIERGRRLEVIDTHAAGPAKRVPARANRRDPVEAGKVRFDGTRDIATSVLYDEKAPRTVRLSPDRVTIFNGARLGALFAAVAMVVIAIAMPWAMVFPLVLLVDPVRRPIRRAITGWLDQAERESA